MLRTMREKFKHLSWTLWLVIITFIVGFSMSDFFSKKDPTMSDLLKVGDESIRRDKFEQQLYLTLDNYNAQFQNKLTQTTINQLRIPEQVLQNLISSTIVYHEAMRMGLTVSNEELGRQLTSHPSFQHEGKFIGRDNYERLLGMRRIRVIDFEENFRRDILLDKLKQIVTAGISIDETSLRDLFIQQSDQVELDYIALTPDFIKEEFDHSAEEVEAFYAANKEDYMSSEMRSGRFLILPFEAMRPQLKLEDDDLFEYYRDNKEEFKIPSRRRISRIFLPYEETDRSAVLRDAQALAETLTSDNFADQARIISRDTKASSGGDWGETEWQSLSKQEVSIAERLTAQKISTPVDSGSGFAILFAAEAIPESYQEFNEIKDRITNVLEREKLRLLARELIDKTAKTAKGSENILENSTDERMQKIDSQPLSNGDPISGADELGYLSRTLFNLQPNELHFPVELPSGLAIAQLSAVHAESLQSLDQVIDRVKADLSLNKKAEKLLVKAESLLMELNGSASEKQQEILAGLGLKTEQTVYRRGNRFAYYPVKDGLDELMFSLPAEQFAQPIDLKQAVIIPRAKKISVSSEEEYQMKRKDLFIEQLSRQRDDYFASYIMNQRDRYPIQFNEPMFSEIRKDVLARYK